MFVSLLCWLRCSAFHFRASSRAPAPAPVVVGRRVSYLDLSAGGRVSVKCSAVARRMSGASRR
jgi:hypothetical protein